MPTRKGSFAQTLSSAIDDVLAHGFDSKQRLDYWLEQLAQVIPGSLVSEATLDKQLKSSLRRVYTHATAEARLVKVHPGVGAFTVKQLRPELQAKLDQHIMASANLITLNRKASIARTLQRMAGWISSVPPGGTEVGNRKDIKSQIKRGIAALPFEERRVIIDQGHKLNASINEIIAVDGGAIAAKWRHVRRDDESYHARPEHLERDGKIFLVRGSWADRAGLVKGIYTDAFEQPAEFVYCSCWYEYIYSLDAIPTPMLTAKGKQTYLETRHVLGASHAA